MLAAETVQVMGAAACGVGTAPILFSEPDRSPEGGADMALQVEVLERSFKTVAPRGDEFVASFYDRLFAAHPEVKPSWHLVNFVRRLAK